VRVLGCHCKAAPHYVGQPGRAARELIRQQLANDDGYQAPQHRLKRLVADKQIQGAGYSEDAIGVAPISPCTRPSQKYISGVYHGSQAGTKFRAALPL